MSLLNIYYPYDSKMLYAPRPPILHTLPHHQAHPRFAEVDYIWQLGLSGLVRQSLSVRY
jgi:hypothetical protein